MAWRLAASEQPAPERGMVGLTIALLTLVIVVAGPRARIIVAIGITHIFRWRLRGFVQLLRRQALLGRSHHGSRDRRGQSASGDVSHWRVIIIADPDARHIIG